MMQPDRTVIDTPMYQAKAASTGSPPSFAKPRVDHVEPALAFGAPHDVVAGGQTIAPDVGLVVSPSQTNLSQTGTFNETLAVLGNETPFTLRSLFEIPFIYKRTIGLSLLISLLLGWLIILIWPRTYESQAKLNIRIGRESVTLDPSATTSETMLMQQTREEEIVSTLEVLNSRQVAIAVVNEVGAGPIIEGVVPAPPGSEKQSSFFTSALGPVRDGVRGVLSSIVSLSGVKDPVSEEELAINRLERSVAIYAPKKSSVVTIEAISKTPEMAKLLVEETISAFKQQHRKSTGTPGSFEFFQSEANRAEEELNELIKERAEFLTENDLVSIDTERDILRAKTVAINTDLLKKRAEVEQLTSEIDDVIEVIDTMDPRVNSAVKEIASVEYTELRTKVFELEVAEKEMSSRYQDNHPTLRATRDQLANAKSLLENTSPRDTNSDTIINPTMQKAEQNLMKLKTRLAGTTASVKEKENQLSKISNETSDLIRLERELIEKDREIAKAEKSLSILTSKLEQSRLIKQLEDKEITNISVFQPATFTERPQSPNKKLVAIGSIFMGLLIGLSLALTREFNSSKIRSAVNVSRLVDRSMVLTLPRISDKKSMEASNDFYVSSCQKLLVDLVLEKRKSTVGRATSLCVGVVGCEKKTGVSTLARNLVRVAEEQLDLRSRCLEYDSFFWTMEEEFGLRLQELKNESDLVIVDLPPATQLNHPGRNNDQIDFLLLVAEAEETNEEEIRTAIERFTSPVRGVQASPPVSRLILTNYKEHLPWIVRRLTNA